MQHHLARRPELAVALVGARALGDQPVERGDAQGAGERERREQGRDVPAAGAQQPARAEPQQERRRRARAAAPTATRARGRARATPTAATRTSASSATVPPAGRRTKSPCRRLSATVAWTSAPGRNEPSGVATMSPSPRADTPTNTIRPAERAGRHPVPQHVDRREAREGPRRAAEAHEHAPVGVERDLAVAEPEGRPPRGGVGEREPLQRPGPRGPWRARGSGRSRRRARRSAASAGGSRPRPADAFMKPGRGRRRLERVEAAEDARRPRHLRRGRPPRPRAQADRAEPARAVDGPVEREGVADARHGPRPSAAASAASRAESAGAARRRPGRRRARRRPNRAPRRGCPARSAAAPRARIRSRSAATRSRGHGQRPASARLRSSTSTRATRPDGARSGAATREADRTRPDRPGQGAPAAEVEPGDQRGRAPGTRREAGGATAHGRRRRPGSWWRPSYPSRDEV